MELIVPPTPSVLVVDDLASTFSSNPFEFNHPQALLRLTGVVPELDDLIGRRANPSDLTAIGLARRQPLSDISEALLVCIERQLSIPITSSQDAAEHLSIALFAMNFLNDSEELNTDRLRLLRLGVQRGLESVQNESNTPKLDGTLVSSLRNFVVSLADSTTSFCDS